MSMEGDSTRSLKLHRSDHNRNLLIRLDNIAAMDVVRGFDRRSSSTDLKDRGVISND